MNCHLGMRRSILAGLAISASAGTWSAEAQHLGPEFQINSYTEGRQDRASVAATADGFVVVWDGYGQDGAGNGIFGQQFDATGAPVGVEFQVNTATELDEDYPVVSAHPDGSFMVVWERVTGTIPELSSLRGRHFGADGLPSGDDFEIGSHWTSTRLLPSITGDGQGRFVVVWHAYDGSFWGVFGQRFGSDGLPLGGEFLVNSYTTNRQFYSSVAADAAGNFVVVWLADAEGGYDLEIVGRRFDPAGAPIGAEFPVQSDTSAVGRFPAVAMSGTGAFVVVWENEETAPFNRDILARRFDAGGTPLEAEFLVNVYTSGTQYAPDVTVSDSGEFVITWSSEDQVGPPRDVFLRHFADDGSPISSELLVNTHTTGNQERPGIAATGPHEFVVVWSSSQKTVGPYTGIFGQRMRSPIFSNGFESGDTSAWSGTTGSWGT
ncbi:MAG: hypothetical protein F9K16_06895 [Thermoanaerobaculia bacterium]|nr:MAG: hypothetical protein F9K16_06895 [Thermoanaerobaculia bacterium]